jgi:hypothetical protein
VRDKTHWNSSNIRPVDPVALGLCKQTELDEAVKKAAARKAAEDGAGALSDEEKMRLMSTEESLGSGGEMRLPSSMAGLENFSLSGGGEEDDEDERRRKEPALDPNAIFNLPEKGEDDEDEDDDDPRR